MSAAQLESYINEVKMMARIKHPNIIRLSRVVLALRLGARVEAVHLHSDGGGEDGNVESLCEVQGDEGCSAN